MRARALALALALTAAIGAQPAIDVDLGEPDQARAALAEHAIGHSFTIELWVRGNYTGEKTRALVGSKAAAGTDAGWVLSAHRSGSWHWNLGNGKASLDYEPTAQRQPLFDGGWHQIAWTSIEARREARLYFDGRNVAIFATNGFVPLTAAGLQLGAEFAGELGRLRAWATPLDDAAITAAYRERFAERAPPPDAATPPVAELNVLAWNIWHGGRENGTEVGVQQVIDVIRDSGADIVCMQETYGSGAKIADALGFFYFLRSSNLSVMSRYPIGETFDPFRPFYCGGARVHLPDGRDLNVYSLWIHHLPDVDKMFAKPDVTARELIDAEGPTRVKEIRGILADLAPVLAATDDVPVILAGDFNSVSHLDWTQATASQHRGLVVEWPVSKACADAGLVDSYRTVHPDSTTHPGLTWSPRFGFDSRIDYVYVKGAALRPTAARVIDEHRVRFPSDHAAVLTTFAVRSR